MSTSTEETVRMSMPFAGSAIPGLPSPELIPSSVSGLANSNPYFEQLNRDMRADRAEKIQWLRAWMAYGQMHLEPELSLRSNLSRVVPPALKPKHDLIIQTYSRMLDQLSPERKAIVVEQARNAIKRSASPQVLAKSLGNFDRFDTNKLVQTCPFFKPVPAVQPEIPGYVLGPTEQTPSFWSYEKMAIYLKKGEIVRVADPFSGDEPYALSILTYLPGEKLLTNPQEITTADFKTVRQTHDAVPPTGLGVGDSFSFTNSKLISDLLLTNGVAAWSTAIALYERDLPERQALEEALKTADNICDGISKVAGFATKLPASVPYVQVVAAAVAVAAQIASGVLDVPQTVLSLFNDTDDYIGDWAISEVSPYYFRQVNAPDRERRETRYGTVAGTGAMYRASLEIVLMEPVQLHDQPDVVLETSSTRSGWIEMGKNSLGMPDMRGYQGCQTQMEFFADPPGGTVKSARGNIIQREAGNSSVYRLDKLRVKKGELVTIYQYNPYFPGGKLPMPFYPPADGLLTWMSILHSYTAAPFGSGYVRYKWEIVAEGETVTVR